MCVCEFHRETGQAESLSGRKAWEGDWEIPEWNGWVWNGWFHVKSIWDMSFTNFSCQICSKKIDDYVLVVQHDRLQDLHELSQLGVCFECYVNIHTVWSVVEPCLTPEYNTLKELYQQTQQKAFELIDLSSWRLEPDYDTQEELEQAFLQMIIKKKKYICFPSQHNYEMLLMAEDVLERLDNESQPSWFSTAEYPYGTLYMRVSKQNSLSGQRFVSSCSTEENETNIQDGFIYGSQRDARKKCAEEVLRLTFRFIETGDQDLIGHMIT